MLRKRLVKSLLAVAAISTMVTGASFALFNASTPNAGNAFSAGTVTLDQPVYNQAIISNLAPGDSDTKQISIKYSGSLDAWLGVDFNAAGDLFNRGLVKDASNVAIGNAAVAVLKETGLVQSTPISPAANTQLVGAVVKDTQKNFELTYSLPTNAQNEYQGKTGSVAINFKAVQKKNNTNSTGNGPIQW